MESRTAGRGRRVAGALVALLVVAALVLWLALREGSGGSPTEQDTPASAGAFPGEDSATRARPRAAPRSADATSAATTAFPASGDAVHVEGWPAADVIVRRSDGRPVPGALVYVVAAGELAPQNLNLVPRRHAAADGTVRFPVAVAGRYDVGAFLAGEPFNGLALDVTFPARSPVEVVLPDLEPLQIRTEGDVPFPGGINVSRAGAERVCAFPGRREDKYVSATVTNSHVLVPRGVRMRVHTSGGILATPNEVVAPGPVTLTADPRREVNVEFVFVADAELAARWFHFKFRYQATPGDPGSWASCAVRLPPAPRETALRQTLLCPPAPTTVRWRCSSDPGRAGGEAVLDAAAVPVGGVHRIEVPVRREDFRLFGFRVIAPTGKASRDLSVWTSLGRLFENEWIVAGQEYWFSIPVEESHGLRAVSESIAATARDHESWLVAAPTKVSPDRVVDLALVPGAQVHVRWERPSRLDAAWPLEVSLVPLSLPADLLVEEPSPALVCEALLLEESAVLGPFPAGDVELVFRFGGREIGRRTVKIVPGTTIDVDAPEILPPMR